MNVTVDWSKVAASSVAKVECGAAKFGRLPATGAQVALRCGGVICHDERSWYVETGDIPVKLPQFGDDNLYDRLQGTWVN